MNTGNYFFSFSSFKKTGMKGKAFQARLMKKF